MRKLLAITVALILALAAVGALADEAHDFGDFSLTYPDSYQLEMNEKITGDTYFTITAPSTGDGVGRNMTCIWSEEYLDLSIVTPQQMLDMIKQSVIGEIGAQGLAVSNLSDIMAERVTLDGLDGTAVAFSCDMDFSGMGMDVQMSMHNFTVIVADPSFGTYTFTANSTDQAGLVEMTRMVDTIAWNR